MGPTARSSELQGLFARTTARSIKTTRARSVLHCYEFKGAEATRPQNAAFLPSARSPPYGESASAQGQCMKAKVFPTGGMIMKKLTNIHVVSRRQQQRPVMKFLKPVPFVVVLGIGLTLMGCGDGSDDGMARAQNTGTDFVAPTVFQAAGPDIASIQNTIEQYRIALKGNNNGNDGPHSDGRREINWDGGGVDTTTAPVTPFNTFLNTRGAQFTTTGTGLSQAPPSGGPQGGLATLFNNPTYGTIFSTFSPKRLFTPVDSNVTEAHFFVPGSNGTVAAKVSGFGAVFTDVDLPDGSGPGNKNGNRQSSTRIECFGTDGGLIFSSFVPASPGDGSLSFFGIVFTDARIARVRITSGDASPGPNDDGTHDIVMMDDFLYGEPQPVQPTP